MSGPVLPAAVVIATRNRPSLLADTVHTIAGGSALPAQLIVVDQGDGVDAGAWRIPGGVDVCHVCVSPCGLSGARNTGAALAAQPLLVFTDDDMRADARWLQALCAPLLASPARVVTTGRVVAGRAEQPGGFVPSLVDRDTPAEFAGRLSVDVLAGGNMAIHREHFLAAHGFDERLGPGRRFPAAEDNDLGFRLLEAGFRIQFVPEACLEHRAWRPASAYVPLRFDYGRGKGAFYLKHLPSARAHMARRILRDLLRRAYRTARLAHHPRLAAAELAYAAGLLRGMADWLRPSTGAADSGPVTHDIIAR